jgi:hypothetical protein
MSTKEAAIMGKWLAQGSGWGPTHLFKSRKKQQIQTTQATQQKQQQQQQQTLQQDTTQRTFQQLDLHGENIELKDGEAFGDTMMTKGTDTLRFISQNLHGIYPGVTIHRKKLKNCQSNLLSRRGCVAHTGNRPVLAKSGGKQSMARTHST